MAIETIKWFSKETSFVFENVFGENKSGYFPENAVILIDRNVHDLYPELFENQLIITVTPAEKTKSLEFVQDIYRKFLDSGVDKSTVVVGVGGGITCDIAGYAAATFYRGTKLILIPTTILAMADASIGGKNGVNFENHKNIVGTIYQPEKIIFDTTFLKTLPLHEIQNGMAEVIKHAIISDEDHFKVIEKDEVCRNILNGSFPDDLLKSTIKVKTDIVVADEFEKGRRKVLNLGHTLGHILELQKGIKHGEAVSIGMIMALKLSVYLNKCSDETLQRVRSILLKYGLPVETEININDIILSLEFDKKKRGDNLHFVFVEEIGKVYDESTSLEVLKKALLAVF